jgi:ATP-dependent RNA helicase RhlE
MGFTEFGLSDQIIKGVHAEGYTTPTPIQSLAIQPALAGKDVIGRAQTGTGKTAAFVLPLLHRLANGNGKSRQHLNVRGLVITPTRELAQQVSDAVGAYGRFVGLRTVTVYGGVSIENQFKLLRRGVDIVIATPGRLLDHMQRGSIDLSAVKILVLDEADRMLDMGFIKDVRRIINALPRERQTMLFGATMPAEVTALAADILRDPHRVDVGESRQSVDAITQHFYTASRETKLDLLMHVLEAEKMESVLVFSRTKYGADKISRRLVRNGILSVAIHSNRTQSQRQRALDGFKQGRFRVLVATDVAARGIDVDGISHVINFDIPHDAESYIHRIGRTGRAGADGDAITFVAPDETEFLRRIEEFTGTRITIKAYPGFTPPKQGATAEQNDSATKHRPALRGKKRKDSWHDRPKRKMFASRKRKGNPGQRTDSFSSDRSGAGWSNY